MQVTNVCDTKNQIIQERKVASFLRHLCVLLLVSIDVATPKRTFPGVLSEIFSMSVDSLESALSVLFFLHTVVTYHTPHFVSHSDVVDYCCVTYHPKLSV